MTEWDDEFEYPEVWIRNSPKIAPTTFEKDDFVTWNFGKDANFDYLDWFVKEPKRFAATLQDDLYCMICKRSICDGQWSIETVCGHKYHLDHLRHWYDVCCRKTLKCPE